MTDSEQGAMFNTMRNFQDPLTLHLLKTHSNVSCRSFGKRFRFVLVSRCLEMSVKNHLRHRGYSLGVLINFRNFGQRLDLLETHSNVSWGSEKHSVEVSAKDFTSY